MNTSEPTSGSGKPPLRQRLIVYGCVFFGAILFAWGGLYYWHGTPRYSLYQMGKAIKNHDAESFMLFLDIDRIVDGLVKSTIREVEERVSPRGPSESASKEEKLAHRQRDVVGALLPQVVTSLRPILKKQIEQGIKELGRKNTVSPLAFCVLSEIEKNGDSAQVTVKAKKDQTYHFTMGRTPERLWKVVSIDMNVLEMAGKHLPGAER